MSHGAQIDYDALAKQAGAISSLPSGSVDYDALARQAGAISSQPGGQRPSAPSAQPQQTPQAPVGGPALQSAYDFGKSALQGLYQVSAPGIAASYLKKYKPGMQNLPFLGKAIQASSPTEQLPGQIMTSGLLGMAGGLDADAPTPEGIAANRARAAAPPPEPSPLLNNPVSDYLKSKLPFYKEYKLGKGLLDVLTKQPEPAAPPAPSAPPEPSAGLGRLPFIPKPPAKLPAGFEPPEPSYSSPTGTADNPASSLSPSRPQLPFLPKPTVNTIGSKVESALGGKPLAPNVPLRQQMPATQAPADLPEGHTPINSSAVRSYKYDPEAQEFHAQYKSGDNVQHVFGDVSPEEAQAFEQAPLPGKAMAAIQQNHPLVAKIMNGKRVAVRPGAPTQ